MKILLGVVLYLLTGYVWGRALKFNGIIDIILFPIIVPLIVVQRIAEKH